jgi:hypothetical protein
LHALDFRVCGISLTRGIHYRRDEDNQSLQTSTGFAREAGLTSNVASVEEGEQVQNGEHGNQPQVHLPENLFGIDRRGVNPFSRPIWVMMLGFL